MSTLSADDQRALDILREAVAEALERKRRLGQYAVIWQDGKIVRLEPEDIPPADLPEPRDRRARRAPPRTPHAGPRRRALHRPVAG